MLALGLVVDHGAAGAVTAASAAVTVQSDPDHCHGRGDLLRSQDTTTTRPAPGSPAPPAAAGAYPQPAAHATGTMAGRQVIGHLTTNRRLAALQVFRC
jgi:hypothetical protein